jgi:predicted Zn-dependent protease
MKKSIISLLVLSIFSTNSFALGLGDLKALKDKVSGSSDTQKSTSDQKNKADTLKSGLGAIGSLLKEETVEEELAVGKTVAAQVLGAAKLHPDQKIQNYVNLIGRHIASQSERADLPWTFAVIDTSSVNAFAAPGGYILITKGLFDLLQTEDELAAVLGHEVSHVIKKHHFNIVKKQKIVEFGSKAVSNGNDNELAKKLSGMVGEMMARGLDKSAEYEADRDGVVLSTRAGYDSSALMSVFDKLELQNKTDASGMKLLFATHPSPNDRRVELVKVITPEIEAAANPSSAKDRILKVK